MTLAIYYVITDSYPEWHFLGQSLKSPGSKVKSVDWYECPFDQRKIFSFGFALPHYQKNGKKAGDGGWDKRGDNTFMCWVCQNQSTNRLYKAAMLTKKSTSFLTLMLGVIKYLFSFPPAKYSPLKQRISP